MELARILRSLNVTTLERAYFRVTEMHDVLVPETRAPADVYSEAPVAIAA
jgi:hypothetical protein